MLVSRQLPSHTPLRCSTRYSASCRPLVSAASALRIAHQFNRRTLATTTDVPQTQKFDALVVGAGPGGLTCASSLLDQGLERLCMLVVLFPL